MNMEELNAILKYCELTFGTTDISVNEALACIDEDAKDAGLTRTEYIDYVVSNGTLPV